MTASSSEDLRCSVQTQGLGEITAGSATAADRFLLVELPLPWPKNIEDHPVLAELPPADPHGPTTRLLGIQRPVGVETKDHRIISYRRHGEQGFATFIGAEVTVTAEELGPALSAMLSGDESSLSPLVDAVDVLICTHGTRDRCCGSMGSLLVMELADLAAENVRLWRTSHTGGHRFAPTGITFPDGLTWAFLDAPMMAGILERSLDPAELEANLRGCAGVDERAAQVADAALFARYGWQWADEDRSSRTEATDDGLVVKITSIFGTHHVSLSIGEPVPVPVCAQPLSEARKSTPQLRVEGIRPS